MIKSGHIDREVTAKLHNARILDESNKRKAEEAKKTQELMKLQEEADIESVISEENESQEIEDESTKHLGKSIEIIQVEELEVVQEKRNGLKRAVTKRPQRKRSSSVLLKH